MTLDELKAAVSALGMAPVLAGFAHLENEIVRQGKLANDWAAESARLTEAHAAELSAARAEIERQRAVNEERLRQAMAREAALKAERDAIATENARLTAEMNRLDSHPEVREAKRKKLEEQHALLKAQIDALDKIGAPAPKGE